jgi:hypothetical protein
MSEGLGFGGPARDLTEHMQLLSWAVELHLGGGLPRQRRRCRIGWATVGRRSACTANARGPGLRPKQSRVQAGRGSEHGHVATSMLGQTDLAVAAVA